jgi:hypothetical protein
LKVEVSQPGYRDPNTREWIPGVTTTHQVRAFIIPTLALAREGLEFLPEGPFEPSDLEIFIPTTDGRVQDILGAEIDFRVQGEGIEGTKVYPPWELSTPHEVIREVAHFAELGGYRWFRARKVRVPE